MPPILRRRPPVVLDPAAWLWPVVCAVCVGLFLVGVFWG